jgi:centrosomal protein CEP164
MTTNRIDSHDGIRSDGMATAVLVFAHHIGIDINEEENLMHIASAYLIDLPDGWELGIPVENEANAGIPYFFNTKSGESVWEHPLEKEILEKVKCERTRLRSAPKVKVISRRQSLTTKESPNKVKERGPETIFNSSLSPSVEAYSQVSVCYTSFSCY